MPWEYQIYHAGPGDKANTFVISEFNQTHSTAWSSQVRRLLKLPSDPQLNKETIQ